VSGGQHSLFARLFSPEKAGHEGPWAGDVVGTTVDFGTAVREAIRRRGGLASVDVDSYAGRASFGTRDGTRFNARPSFHRGEFLGWVWDVEEPTASLGNPL